MSFKNINVMLVAFFVNLAFAKNCFLGSYHLHSTFSDGRLSISEIAEEARKAGLNFLMLTDHGDPNLEASLNSGYLKGIYVIGGSEVGLYEGHSTLFFYKPGAYRLPPDASSYLREVHRQNSFAIIAHPFDRKVPWKGSYKGFDGIELLNFASCMRSSPFFKKVSFLLYYPFSYRSLLKLIFTPSKNFRKWDSLLSQGEKIYGFFATDAHGKTGPIPLPSYERVFRLVNLVICTEKSHLQEEDLISSIKQGNFYNLIRYPPSGYETFEFYAVKEGKKISQGSLLPPPATLFIRIPENRGAKAYLIHDGRRTVLRKRKITLRAEKGYYRVEVFYRDRPWIVSNPIFLLSPGPDLKSTSPAISKLKPLPLKFFKVECDEKSKGFFDPERRVFRFFVAKATKAYPDRWCALALRKKISLHSWRGILVNISSSRRLRFWIQLEKDNKRWFYNASTEKEIISFDSFYLWNGKKEKISPYIKAFFISFDSSTLFTPFEGEVKLESLAFYR